MASKINEIKKGRHPTLTMASRDDGFAPTPYSVIHWMIDQSILDLNKRKISLKEATVLDVAAGDGRFLVETFKKLNSSLETIKKSRSFEIDDARLIEARENLSVFLVEEYSLSKESSQTIAKSVIHHQDSLVNDWDYDLIIGNPPYLRTHDLSEEERIRFLEMDELLEGRLDLMTVFLAKGIRSVCQNSTLCLIISRSWQGTNACRGIREFLRSEDLDTQVFDFSDNQVFEEAVLSSVVLISKSSENNLRLIECDYQNEKVIVGEEITEKGSGGLPFAKKAIAEKFIPLTEIGKVSCGIKTTCDKVFVRRSFDKFQEKLKEEGESHPLLSSKFPTKHIQPFIMKPSDAGKWSVNSTTDIFYPFDDNRKFIGKESDPHLQAGKEMLSARSFLGNRPWYDMWVKSSPIDFRSNWKIVWPEISNAPNFSIDKNKRYVGGSVYYFVPNKKMPVAFGYYLLGMLNSSVTLELADKMGAVRLLSGRIRWKKGLLDLLRIPFKQSWFTEQMPEDIKKLVDIARNLANGKVEETDKLISKLNLLVERIVQLHD